MIKLVSLLNRKSGMSMSDFRTYYEERHVPLITRLLPFAVDYRRNFALEEQPYRTAHMAEGRPNDRVFDVMTELTFADMAMFQRMLDTLSDPEIGRLIAEDEANFLDRAASRSYLVEERRSDLQPGR
jgi:uncharacterized protein (TIGR02118 family)